MAEKITYQFDDFLATVDADNKDFVLKINEVLQNNNYKSKVENKASGFFVAYTHPKTKRNIMNFLFRKNGLLVRIYADNFNKYTDFLNLLPEEMEKEIAKSTICKRLINPNDCNPKCIMGYDFSIRNTNYKKCRYSCFQFAVNPSSMPVLSDFIENERKERQA